MLLAALEPDGELVPAAAEPPFEPLVVPLVVPLAEPALLSFFSVSVEEAALELDDGAAGEVLSEPLALLEPPAALSFFSFELVALDEEDGVLGVELPDMELDEELSLFFEASTLIDVEPEPEPEGAGAAELDEAEPEGAAGVVELDDEEEPAPEGAVAGLVVVLELLEAARSPGLSQPVRMPAPSARETATAKVVSLICCVLRGLGYRLEEQDSGLIH